MTGKFTKDKLQRTDVQRTLPMALLRAREAVMERFRPVLVESDVTEQQWRVMRVLNETGETDASDLAARACLLAPSLTRIMKTLDSKGYITTRRDPSDGRRALVQLTADGLHFVQNVDPISNAVYEEIEDILGETRLGTLLDELESVWLSLNKKQDD